MLALVGAIMGGGGEYLSQVVDNFNNSKEQNFLDKCWDAGTNNIDGADILIATGAGALTGLTNGLNLVAGIAANATINVAEDLAKSNVGSKKSEYGGIDALKSVGSSLVGDVAGTLTKKAAQATPEGVALKNKATKLEAKAEKSGNWGLTQRAVKASNNANNFGSKISILTGGATSKTINYMMNLQNKLESK